jgi:hypothetical protein
MGKDGEVKVGFSSSTVRIGESVQDITNWLIDRDTNEHRWSV